MKKICFFLSILLTVQMLSVQVFATNQIVTSLTQLQTWNAEGTKQTLQQTENANEAGTGTALLSSGYDASSTSWEHRLRYGQSITIEKGKTYRMSIKLKAASAVSANVTIQGMILNVRPSAYNGYTVVTPDKSVKDTAVYFMGEKKYSASNPQWDTIQTGTVTVDDILDASGNSVTSMQVTLQMYLKTGQGESLGFYIEELSFEEVSISDEENIPEAQQVSITKQNNVLTGNYTFFDSTGAPEAASSYRWLRGTNETDLEQWTVVDSGTCTAASLPQYALSQADEGKSFVFEITPRNNLSSGIPVCSAPYVFESTPSTVVISGGDFSSDAYAAGQNLGSSGAWKAEGSNSFLVIANANEAGNNKAIQTVDGSQTSNYKEYRLRSTQDITMEKGFTYHFVIKMKAVTASAQNTLVQINLNNVKASGYDGYSAARDQEAASYISGPIYLSSTYPAGSTDWITLRIPVTFYGLKNASGTEVDSWNLIPQIYIRTFDNKQYLFETISIEKIVDTAPVATQVSVTEQDGVLTGQYVFSDQEGDWETTSSYRWLRGTDLNHLEQWSVVNSGTCTAATLPQYTLTTTDYEQYIAFEITPSTNTLTGNAVCSAPYLAPCKPKASQVEITGGGVVGRTVTGQYLWSDPNEEDTEENTSVCWKISEQQSGPYTPVEGAVNDTYTIQNGDSGKWLVFEVTPGSSSAPSQGDPVASNPLQIVQNNTAPSAESVKISGYTGVGYQVTGTYLFLDAEYDQEGNSLYQWYLCDTATGTFAPITGADEVSLDISQDWAGKFLKFSVTPVDQYGKQGEIVYSNVVEITSSVASKLYIAPNGDDDNNGSIEEPFATLEKARNTIRSIKQSQGLPEGGITVYLRGGTYQMQNSFSLTAQDSGSQNAPIIYTNYANENVVLNGGITIDPTKSRSLTNAEKQKIITESARDEIVAIDLKAQGFTSDDYQFNFEKDGAFLKYRELAFDGKILTPARYPNEGSYNTVNSVVSQAGKSTFIMTYSDPRPAQWTFHNNIWMFGFWMNDWYGEYTAIKSLNVSNATIESAHTSNYGLKAGQKYYYFNLFEEIDVPGEYYLDQTTGILYLYPPQEITNNSVLQMSELESAMITLEEADYVTISGLRLEMGTDHGLSVKNSDNFLLNNCKIVNFGKTGVVLNGGKNATIQNSLIRDMGSGGISVNTGNRKTLESGNTLIENNEIAETSRIKSSYAPNINLNGVGAVIRHNKIHGNGHAGIIYYGNEFLIEYNEFYDLVRQAQDMGAIYTGRNPSELGNVIQYNYFYDISSINASPYGAQAIFIDDGSCGTKVFGNVFYNAGNQYVFKTNGGQYNHLENNIMIGGAAYFTYFQSWGVDGNGVSNWTKYLSDNYSARNGDIVAKLNAVDYKNPPYSEKYPWLAVAPDTNIGSAKTNVLKNNVVIGKQLEYRPNSEGGNNITAQGDVGFIDYQGGNFNLRQDSTVYTQIPGFQPVPFSEMGLLEEANNELPQALSVNLAGIPAVNDILFGKYTYFDTEGDSEAYTQIYWEISDTKDGNYTTITGQNSESLSLNVGHFGKWIRFCVKPVDYANRSGLVQMSEPVQIGLDHSILKQTLNTCKQQLNQASVGEKAGQFSQAAIDLFQSAIEQEEPLLDQGNITDQQLLDGVVRLKEAYLSFVSSMNSGIVSISLHGLQSQVVVQDDPDLTGKYLLVCYYDGQGRLLSANREQITNQREFHFPASAQGTVLIKAFIWESWNNMIPVGGIYELQLS